MSQPDAATPSVSTQPTTDHRIRRRATSVACARSRSRGPMPRSPPAAPTIAQQMSELAELHRHGVITDAEYEQKRRELLDRL